MLKNYLKIGLRALTKHKGHTFINVVGLALGMACCLLLFQYVAYETSFDDFHTKRDRLHRATFQMMQNDVDDGTTANVGYIFGPTVAEEIPEVIRYVRIHPNYGDAVLSYQEGATERTFTESKAWFVDSTFFAMFDFPLVMGDKARALAEPNTLFLSETLAQKYFGNENPMGKSLVFTGWVNETYTVSGVFADVPSTSHLQFDVLLPMQDLLADGRFERSPWGWQNFVTYVELPPSADVAAIEDKVTSLYMRYRQEDFTTSNTQATSYLQPLADIHLNEEIQAPAAKTGSRKTVYFFTIIGLITLIIALVNYVNLSTARAMDRAKEVGVRKVVGARKGQLVSQFLMESVLTNGLALAVAIGLSLVLLPLVNGIADTAMSFDLWADSRFWVVFLGVFGGSALIAGLYPAFVLSSFRPATVLKGETTGFSSRARLRQALVVVQFAATIALLAGTAIVYAQLSYMRGLDTGLDLEQVLVVASPSVRAEGGDREAEMATLKEELSALSAVRSIGLSTTTPGQGFMWYTGRYRDTQDPSTSQPVRGNWIDHGFAEVYGLEIVAGSGFHASMAPPDSGVAVPIIVNEALVQALGYDSNEAAIGTRIIGSPESTGQNIVGVFRDFRWSSVHQETEAVMFEYRARGGDISMKVSTADLPGLIAEVRTRYEDLFPGNPFEYQFADAAFDEQYKNDQRFATLFSVFAAIAIVIACLGLFGLAAYTAERRRKEIGVRKVLGASVPQLVTLLSKDFLVLVLVSFAAAVPVAYFVMSRWLDEFAYRIDLGPGLFLLAGTLALVIALATVSYHALRAATADPVKALRYE